MMSLQSNSAGAALNLWAWLCSMAPAGLEGREGGERDTLEFHAFNPRNLGKTTVEDGSSQKTPCHTQN